MITRLKNSRLGKALYRLSRRPGGGLLRWMAKGVQAEEIQITHLSRKNRQHNRRQTQILTQFENHGGPSS